MEGNFTWVYSALFTFFLGLLLRVLWNCHKGTQSEREKLRRRLASFLPAVRKICIEAEYLHDIRIYKHPSSRNLLNFLGEYHFLFQRILKRGLGPILKKAEEPLFCAMIRLDTLAQLSKERKSFAFEHLETVMKLGESLQALLGEFFGVDVS